MSNHKPLFRMQNLKLKGLIFYDRKRKEANTSKAQT